MDVLRGRLDLKVEEEAGAAREAGCGRQLIAVDEVAVEDDRLVGRVFAGFDGLDDRVPETNTVGSSPPRGADVADDNGAAADLDYLGALSSWRRSA
jgi:hypothetical protein